MSKRAWLTFAVVQIAGCLFAGYGTVYSRSAFVRDSWVAGFLLLLPGNLSGEAAGQVLIHWRTAFVFIPVAVATNALVWTTLSGLWRILRRSKTKGPVERYTFALAVAGLVFVTANTINFVRPMSCYDCFFRYGLPFTLYHDGGFVGGAGVAWAGLVSDTGCVLAAGLTAGRIWNALSTRNETHDE